MARGWESKAVKDQIAAFNEKPATSRPLTAAEREARVHRETLQLARSKVLADIANARDDRHLAVLRESLRFLDAEIAKEG